MNSQQIPGVASDLNFHENPIGFVHTLQGESQSRQFSYYQQAGVVATEHSVMTESGQSQVIVMYCSANDTDPQKKYVWDGTETFRKYYDAKATGNVPPGQQTPPEQQEQAPPQGHIGITPPLHAQAEPVGQQHAMSPCIEIDIETFTTMQVQSKVSDFLIQFLVSSLRKHLEPESEDMMFIDERMMDYNRQIMELNGVPQDIEPPPHWQPTTNEEDVVVEGGPEDAT